MQAERINIPPSIRIDALVHYGHRCIYCGATSRDAKLQVDHVIPVAHGGTNEIGNLVVACQTCNIGKGKKLLLEITEGDIGVYVKPPKPVAEFGGVPAKAARDEFAEKPLEAWLPKLAEKWPHIRLNPSQVEVRTKCRSKPTVSFTPSVLCAGRVNSDIGANVRVLVVPWRSVGGFSPEEQSQIAAAVISGYAVPTLILMGTPALFFGVVVYERYKGTPKGRVVDHFLEPTHEWGNDSWYPDENMDFQDLREPYRRTPDVMHVLDFDEPTGSLVGVYASFDGMGVWNGL